MQILELKKHIVYIDAVGAAMTLAGLLWAYVTVRRLFVISGRQDHWDRLLTGITIVVFGFVVDFLDQVFKLPDVIQHFAENMLILAGVVFIVRAAPAAARSLMLAGDVREFSGALLPTADGAPVPKPVRLVTTTATEPTVEPVEQPVQETPQELPLVQETPVEVSLPVTEGRSRGSYIIGNTVGRTIVAMDGHTIATEGELITSEIIEDAKASGRIADLIVDMVVRDRFQGV